MQFNRKLQLKILIYIYIYIHIINSNVKKHQQLDERPLHQFLLSTLFLLGSYKFGFIFLQKKGPPPPGKRILSKPGRQLKPLSSFFDLNTCVFCCCKEKEWISTKWTLFHQVLDLTFTRAFFASCTASASPPSMSVAGSAKTKMRSSSTMTGS